MDLNTVTQLVTAALAVLAVIWHHQRTTSKLRNRLVNVEHRLARMEGFLGIGMPAAAAAKAPGADLARKRPEDSEEA